MKTFKYTKAKHGSRPMIGIIGGHLNNTNHDALTLAEKVGEHLAKLGFAIVCGGEDGIMEAVCKGAKKHDGVTVAITKSNDKNFRNEYIDYVIPTSLDLAFMNVLVWSSDVIIAFDGRYGTMCELGLILDIGKPLVMLGKHELVRTDKIKTDNFVHYPEYSDESAKEAVRFVVSYFKEI